MNVKCKEYILSDLEVWENNNKGRYKKKGSVLNAYFKDPMFKYQYWLRVRYFSKKRSFKRLFASYKLRKMSKKWLIFVPNIYIGKGMMIVHPGNIYLNAKSIGDHFTVYQGCTLGSDKGGIPLIGNNVTCYVNSVICGDIQIGDNCTFGANSFCNKSVGINSIIMSYNVIKIKVSKNRNT